MRERERERHESCEFDSMSLGVGNSIPSNCRRDRASGVERSGRRRRRSSDGGPRPQKFAVRHANTRRRKRDQPHLSTVLRLRVARPVSGGARSFRLRSTSRDRVISLAKIIVEVNYFRNSPVISISPRARGVNSRRMESIFSPTTLRRIRLSRARRLCF